MVKITPILQSLLINQLSVIEGYMNSRAYYEAWGSLVNLLDISPNEVKETMADDIKRIQEQINAVTSDKQQDVFQQRATQSKRIKLICAGAMHGLLKKTMKAFYDGGYMEFGKREPAGEV